ncbi:hypothetical protein JTP68_01615 [Dietzia cinnamea]|uniref:hypothetical protein n=1 Tax=Dietzia cinnamea TaxID=321318 RepID=UPI000D6078D7|nr:hypothetical protein [Dietzia cinnamea]PWD96940.1 hypothetical protein DEQ16_02995 [Dietzia maris]
MDLIGGSTATTPLVLSVDLINTGSDGMQPLSTELIATGSDDMAPLSTDLLGGSSDLAPLTGSTGMTPLITSVGMEPLSTELNLLGGSAELPALSAEFPDGSTEGIGGSAVLVGKGLQGSLTNGSANEITEPVGGSITDGGALSPIIGSIAEGGVLPALAGSMSDISGSISGNGGSTGQSSDTINGSAGGGADVLLGSVEELTTVNGSLTAFTGSLANGSTQGTTSTNLGSTMGTAASMEAGGSLLPVLAVTTVAGGGAAIATATATGGVALPPLPTLCDLPSAQVDQLGALGSADAQRCTPGS